MFADSPLINVWLFIIIVMTIVRILIKKWLNQKLSDWTAILLHTFGMSFSVPSSQVISNRSEKVLILFLGMFAILASIFCSGYLIKQYTIDSQTRLIKTLEDLNKSMLPIYACKEIYSESYANIEWLRRQYNIRYFMKIIMKKINLYTKL